MEKRPLLWAFAAVLCGEVMAYLFPGRWSAVLLTAAVFAAGGAACMRWGVQRKQTADKRSLERQGKRNLLLPFFLAALVLAGGSRMTAVLAEDPLCARAEEAGRAGVFLELSGRVRDIRASAEDGWKVTVTVYFPMPSAEESGACSVRSRVLLYLDRLPEAEPGDPVRISGTFRAFEHATNPGQFDRFEYARAEGLAAYSSDASVVRSGSVSAGGRFLAWIPRVLFRFRLRLLAAADGMSETCPLGESPLAERRSAEHWRDSCGILAGMFLGERARIPGEVRNRFGAAGIAHMLAISGLHIGLIGMRTFRFLKKKLRLDYVWSTSAAAAIVLLYCALAGFTPSSLRALVMFGTMIIGEASSQPYDGLSALSLSGLILCTLSPLRITQAGFQLSFLSAAAISAAAPAAERFVQASEHERGPLFGLGMQTVTLPAVTAHYFRVPVAGLFLNPVLIPALPAAAGASFAALMTALVSPGTGSLIFLPVHLLFEGMRVVCSPAEAVPALHVLTGQPSLPKRAVCLAVLIAAVIGMRKIAERDAKRNKEEGTDRRPGSGMDAGAGPVYRPGLCPRPSLNRRQKRRRRLCLITLFLVMTAFLQKQPAHELRITFLDVGQGDGIFVEFPSGVTALIDCGSSDVNQVGEYRLEPFLDSMARESPDMVFLTHLDEDHVSGIRELAADGRAPRVFLSDAFSEEKRQEKEAFIRSLEEQGIAVTLLRAGDVWTDRSGAQLACVMPSGAAAAEDENDTSLVLLLTYGEFSALFTGDIGGDREAEICERLGGLGFPAGDMYGSVTDGEDHLSTGVFRQEPHILSVLKAAHHGSDSSTGEALLAALRPTLAVISCGRENRYGHPAAGTLSRLEAAGTRAIVTAEAGCVIVTADRSGIMDVAAPYRRE